MQQIIERDNNISFMVKGNRKYFLTPQIKRLKKLNVIDLFNQYETILVNKTFFNNQNKVGFIPTFILDSNVVGNLKRFKENKLITTDDLIIKEDLQTFLTYLSKSSIEHSNGIDRIYDVNPIFYVLECIINNVPEEIIIDNLISIIQIQTMNYRKYLAMGIIEKDPNLKDAYLKEYSTFDIKKIAQYNFYRIKQENIIINEYKEGLNITYILLLKIAQISLYYTKKPLLEKIHELRNFFNESLGIFSIRELNVALYFFTNNIGGFIPTNKKNCDDVLKIIYNSSIDISLLRISEIMISKISQIDDIYSCVLAYPVTFEKSISTISSNLFFENQIIFENEFYTLFNIDYNNLKISNANLNKLYKEISENDFSEETIEKRNKKRQNRSVIREKINYLIQDTEISIKQYYNNCKYT
jgi:hypothetical protein